MKVYTVIDLETTGLDPKEEQITEISAIKYTEEGKEVGRFHTLVVLDDDKEPSPYTPHITRELCETGMIEEEAIVYLDNFAFDTTLIIQYAPFDLSFLKEKSPYGSAIEEFYDFYCTRFLSKNIWFDQNPSLSFVARRLGIPNEEHHSAVNDCQVTFKVFQRLKHFLEESHQAIEPLANSVCDFKDRPLKYRPFAAKVFKEFDNCLYQEESEWWS